MGSWSCPDAQTLPQTLIELLLHHLHVGDDDVANLHIGSDDVDGLNMK